jgi:murein DD-endopeptidase / murein LD-carboxypeptidase
VKIWMINISMILLCCINANAQVDLISARPAFIDTLAALKFFEGKGLKVDSCVNQNLYFEIYKWLDTPYLYGGETGKGIDCSGFCNKMYQAVYGKTLEGGSRDIYTKVKPINIKLAEEGDLLFFKIWKGQISHVGIYLQGRKFAHATTQAGVIISDLDEAYYKKYFFKAGRLLK